MKVSFLLAISWPLLMANACSEKPTTSATQLAGTEWIVEYLYGNPLPAEVLGSPPTLSIERNNTVSSNGSCNSYSGPISISGERITIGPLIQTERYCPHMEVEDKFLQALETSSTYQLNTGKLELLNAEEITAVLRAKP
jgi:heat shock protein HslJ